MTYTGVPSPSTLVAAADMAHHDMSAPHAVGIAVAIVAIVLIALAFITLMIVSVWKLYKKAGVPGWASIVPIYSYVKMLEIVRLPLWLVLIAFIPFANVATLVLVAYRLARVFGRGAWFTVGLIFLPFIFYPILAFGASTYQQSVLASGMSDAAKWTVIGAGVFGAFYFLLFSLTPQFDEPRSAGLSIIHSDNSSGGYATDGRYVYYQDELIAGADPSSFYMAGDYAIDRYGVYSYGSTIPGANPSNFRVGLGAYATDDTTVYFDGTPILGADPVSFTELSYDYAEDYTHVYYDGSIVTGADPMTFKVEDGTIGKYPYDARDSKHYYYYGEDAMTSLE